MPDNLDRTAFPATDPRARLAKLIKPHEGYVADPTGRAIVYDSLKPNNRWNKMKEAYDVWAKRTKAAQPTIGYGLDLGSLSPDKLEFIKNRGHITKGLAQQWLHDHITRNDKLLANRYKKQWPTLNPNQQDALRLFFYNVGTGKKPAVDKAVLNNTMHKVPNAFKLYNKITVPKTNQKVVSPGLMKRRAAEATLFNTPYVPPGGSQ